MQKVKNKKCIHRLSQRSLRTAKTRNIIAVIAIALTALLFTSLFTIAMSMNRSFQEQNFRQVGGSFHGAFKNVTKEQAEVLKKHPLIKEAGYRLILGMPVKEPFHKTHVEIGYAEKACADAMYCVPEKGRLPKEGTLEIATDTRVLRLLGVEPGLGEEVTLSWMLGESGREITQTFTLSGFWEYNEVSTASHVLVAESYVRELLKDYVPAGDWDVTGRMDLYVNLKNSYSIGKDLKQVLSDCGYQNENAAAADYIAIGVNWGYTGAQFSNSADIGTWVGIGAALILIIFTGYLIIYNIFRISVTGDIRFYGLLKTIGTTGKQIKAIILRQALLLSCIGIPIGLAAGWLCGAVLTPVVMSAMSYKNTVMSVSPVIFVAAAVFALITVFISCRRPGRLAARVSPVEAVRYTEGSIGRKKHKKGEGGAKVYRMAFSNLGRSRTKTALVVISLSLAVVLLNFTYTFTQGFDMDKYLKYFTCTDFILGHADYFQVTKGFHSEGSALPEAAVETVKGQKGITEGGKIYGQTTNVKLHMSKEDYLRLWKDMPAEIYAEMEKNMEPDENGMVEDFTNLYGMEEFPLALLKVIEGDLEKLSDGSGNYIAAVVETDDYGNPMENTNHSQVGDTLKLTFIDEIEYRDSRTGKLADENTPMEEIEAVPVKTHEKTYTIAARVTMPSVMGYRFYGYEQYVLPAEEFIRETGTKNIMNYLFNTTKEDNKSMEAFLKNYTEKVETELDYESKEMMAEKFYEFRNMFLLMGGALSFIIGVIGILNFINAEVTSMLSRKRELAVLEAVGMTGKELKTMLVLEGVSYGIMAILAAFGLNLVVAPLLSDVFSGMFWFYTYKFTVLPILLMLPVFLLLGVILPLLVYHFIGKQSVVERIRETE